MNFYVLPMPYVKSKPDVQVSKSQIPTLETWTIWMFREFSVYILSHSENVESRRNMFKPPLDVVLSPW